MDKVYVIETGYKDTWKETAAHRDSLKRNIVELAQRMGEDIAFHRFADHMLEEAPLLMVACTPAFRERLSELPGFESMHPVWSDVTTVAVSSVEKPDLHPMPAARPGRDSNLGF